MRRMLSGKMLAVSAFALIGVAAYAVPQFLLSEVETSGALCAGPGADGKLCRFIGGPIEMGGTPVFVEKFQHAFLPTTRKIDFVDGFGETWTAPPKTLTDGASIPTLLEPLMGDRQSREYLLAAALHDAYCGVGNEQLETFQTRPWEEVHRMFYEALLVAGTDPIKAKMMFAAVYLGGPRWNDPERSLKNVSVEALKLEAKWCLEWIEDTNPEPEEIIAWMTRREEALKAGENTKPVYDMPDGI
ncbi:DUF1353 domain-containing protein [Pacificoceanicola onchidii]|uniref:DUF1353 domain-containing protein n=1 Tax=Pacificoceanicola onchidii TaxID=2562685 RepID=UPI0010A65833|nr:DUF1353 domain-containing protein [Pacificoceanicola onchidii]